MEANIHIFTRSLLALGLAALLPSQAIAEPDAPDICGPVPSYNLSAAANKLAGKWDVEMARQIVQLALACKDNPDMQLGRALTLHLWHQQPGMADGDRYALMDMTWEALLDIDRTGKPTLNYSLRSEIGIHLLTMLVEIADAKGASIPAFSDDGALPICPYAATNWAQTLWYEYKKSYTGRAPGFILKLADACRAETKRFDRQASFYAAEMLVGQAGQITDPTQSAAKAQEALPYMTDYIGDSDRPADSTEKSLLQNLARYTAATSKPDIAAFSSAPGLAYYRQALVAYWADAMWPNPIHFANNTLDESSRVQLDAYRAFVSTLSTIAHQAGGSASAEIYEGLKLHTDKVIRSNGHETITGPPEILFRSLKPSPEG